jgi:DNA-binding NarL/FixJ family response regulator
MRTIVVSRYPVCREGISRLVGALSDHEEVVGVSDLDEALGGAADKPADLVILEVSSGDVELAQLKRTINAVKPAPVVLFAMLSQAEVQAARDSGVSGCVPKTAPPDLFMAALKLILAGGLYFSDFGETTAKPPAELGARSRLSARQLGVLKLIEIGQTNKEIAKALGISVATVKLHVQAILNITGARNRTEAALRARGQIG